MVSNFYFFMILCVTHMPVSSGLKKTWGERGALLCPEAGDRE